MMFWVGVFRSRNFYKHVLTPKNTNCKIKSEGSFFVRIRGVGKMYEIPAGEGVKIELRIQLLGGFSVSLDGTTIPEERWRSRRARSLVKLLALTPGHRLHRDQVCETFWPGSAPSSATHCSPLSTVIRNGRAQWAHSVWKVTASVSCFRCPCTKGIAIASAAQGE